MQVYTIRWDYIGLALILHSRLSKSNRKLITLDDLKDKSSYASLALRICVAINLLIIPALLGVCFASLPYILIDNYIYSTILSIFLLIYMDQYLPCNNYPVQTRSIGFFCAGVFGLFQIVNFKTDYNPLDIGFLFDANNYPIDNTIDFLVHTSLCIFSISVLSSLIFICIRSSQQGSQFLVSLLIATCLIETETFLLPICISILLVFNIPLYQPSLDSMNFFRSHILNRIHDNDWYLNTYGVQKYQFFSNRRNDWIL